MQKSSYLLRSRVNFQLAISLADPIQLAMKLLIDGKPYCEVVGTFDPKQSNERVGLILGKPLDLDLDDQRDFRLAEGYSRLKLLHPRIVIGSNGLKITAILRPTPKSPSPPSMRFAVPSSSGAGRAHSFLPK
jgi:hypothetical protein